MLLLEHFEILSKQEKEKFQNWLKLELAGREPLVLAMAVFLERNEEEDLSVSPLLENRVIRSKLLHKIQEFIAIETFKKDQAQKDLYFMRAIRERKQEQHFPKFHKKARKRLSKQYAPSANYFHYLFQFEWFNHVYAIQHTPRKEEKEDFIERRTHYFVQWIKHELALLSLHFFQTKPQSENFAELLHWLGKRKYDKKTTEELELFFAMKDLFGQAAGVLASTELEHKVLSTLQHSYAVSKSKSFTDLQFMAINYFIQKADDKPSKTSYLQLLELYEWLLKNKLVPFTVQTFRTISMTYMNLAYLQKETKDQQIYLDEAQSFMQKHKSRLPEEEQEYAYTFMQAMQDFIQKKYRQVIKGDLFRSSEKTDPHYEYGYQFILLQSEYELNEIEELLPNLRYLGDRIRRRQGLSDRTKTIHANRIRFFRKLLQKNDWEDLKKLKEDIKKTRHLGGRVWILEKVQEKIDQFLNA